MIKNPGTFTLSPQKRFRIFTEFIWGTRIKNENSTLRKFTRRSRFEILSAPPFNFDAWADLVFNSFNSPKDSGYTPGLAKIFFQLNITHDKKRKKFQTKGSVLQLIDGSCLSWRATPSKIPAFQPRHDFTSATSYLHFLLLRTIFSNSIIITYRKILKRYEMRHECSI